MEPLALLLLFSLAIIAVSLVGAAIPQARIWSGKQLHLMTALSAGVFIGATFLILLPEASEDLGEPADAMMWVMIGFIAILLVEVILKARHEEHCDEHTNEHKHAFTSMTAFIGLAVHSALDGFAIGAALVESEDIGIMVFLAILAHKAIDTFSLSTTFSLAGIGRRHGMRVLLLFSLITPIAAAVTFPMLDTLESFSIGIPLALAGGTFMFVGIYDLLPEAFHEKRSDYLAYCLVIIGIVVMYALQTVLEGAGI